MTCIMIGSDSPSDNFRGPIEFLAVRRWSHQSGAVKVVGEPCRKSYIWVQKRSKSQIWAAVGGRAVVVKLWSCGGGGGLLTSVCGQTWAAFSGAKSDA